MDKEEIHKFSQLRAVIIGSIGISMVLLNWFEKPIETKNSLGSSQYKAAHPMNPVQKNDGAK